MVPLNESKREDVMNLEQAFDMLKNKLGTDRHCAEYLLITQNYFNGLRKGRVKASKKTEVWIISMAEKLDKKD